MTNSPWWTIITPDNLLDLRARVLFTLRKRLGPSAEADLDDLVQHAFAVLFRRPQAVDAENDGLYRYLLTVAANAWRDQRTSARVRRRQPGALPEQPTAPANPTEQRELNDKLREIFCALDERDRLIFWRHAVDGCSVRSIAAELGLGWHRVFGVIERVRRDVRRQIGTLP